MEYRVLRSQRKTMALEITPQQEVLVRAPLSLPQAQIEAFVAQKQDWILRQLARQRAYQAACPEPTAEQLAAWTAQAKGYIPMRVAHYAALLGLYPSAVKINSARRRFGSCSGKNSLNFSCLLMRYPAAAIDYVVVHELAHIRYKNHGAEFYRLVETILPDYRKRQALLRPPFSAEE